MLKGGEMKTSEADKILSFMQVNPKGITAMDALKLFGCMRLASRISDLRKRGHKIIAESIKVQTRTGEAWVTRYRLEG